MKPEPDLHNLSVSPSGEYRVDQLCTAFERAWKSGIREPIENWLPRVPEPIQPHLFHELIQVEVELRRVAGESPQAGEYQQRFPEQGGIVEAAFKLMAERRQSDRSLAATVTFGGGQDTSAADLEVSGQPDDVEPIPEAIGRYSVMRALGQGAFGKVYLARDPRLDRLVAIKVASASQFATSEGRERFLLEARSAARLDHPGIVQVYEVDDFGDLLYIVQQFIDGRNLAACVRLERWPLERIVSCLAGVARALAFAHKRGLVHCDLKPANILVDCEGNPHVADFGLAIDEETQRARRGEKSGTPRYMSPEQVRGDAHQLDGRSDIWSLGVILYELVTGRPPFAGASRDELFDEILSRDPKPPRMIDDKVPAELERIILRCLAKSVTGRYSSASEVARDLQKLGPRPQRWRWAAAAAAVLVPLGIFWRPFAPPENHSEGKSEQGGAGSTSVAPVASVAAPVAATVNSPGDLIESFRVVHFRDQAENSERIGEIGVESQAAREDDLVQVVARFRQPLYCYLIAFNPDGSEQLCHPADGITEPQRLDSLEFPAWPSAFRLTDGAGQQAFAIVASKERLPTFDEWRRESGPVPWQHVASSSVIKFDGQHVAGVVLQAKERGQIEKLKGVEPFERLCQFLAVRSKTETIQALAFPVLAKSPPLEKARRPSD